MEQLSKKKIFIITGTSRGLGEALVSRLINNKSNFIIGISRDITEKQKKFDKKQFSFIRANLFDVVDQNIFNEWKLLFERGDLIYINNAASIKPIKNIGNFQSDEISQFMNLNVVNPIKIVNDLLRVNPGSFQVINISSGAARNPIQGWSLYCSSKAALEMYINVASLENPEMNFINIDPGVMDTGMQENIRNCEFKDRDKFLELKKENKLRDPINVANEIIELLK